jgi:hypothetical protein
MPDSPTYRTETRKDGRLDVYELLADGQRVFIDTYDTPEEASRATQPRRAEQAQSAAAPSSDSSTDSV